MFHSGIFLYTLKNKGVFCSNVMRMIFGFPKNCYFFLSVNNILIRRMFFSLYFLEWKCFVMLKVLHGTIIANNNLYFQECRVHDAGKSRISVNIIIQCHFSVHELYLHSILGL